VAVAAKLDVNQATVSKWRRRFLERRLDGLVDEPGPGAPCSISDDDVERVIVCTLEDKPTDATHWSTRDLAAKVGMSASSVGHIWQAFGPNRRCRCVLARSSDARMTTSADQILNGLKKYLVNL
jgi:transposase